MKIGIFTDQFYPIISGVVTSIKMLYEGLEKLGHEVYVITFHTGDDNLDQKQKDELNTKNIIYVKGHKYPFKAVEDYKYAFRFKKAIKDIGELNLDIIHVQTEFSIAKLAKKVSKKYKIPLVHTLHTSYKDYICYLFPKLDKVFHRPMVFLFRRLFTNPIIKKASYEILPTKKVLKDFKLYYKKKKDIAIIPTGIDIDSFLAKNTKEETINELRLKHNIKPDDFIFIYVGRTSSEKNIKDLIKSFGNAFGDNDKAKFIIVGGGPELEELKECASAQKNKDNIIFTGLIEWDYVHNYYQMADVFLNASVSETQGLTYIEALASGITPLVRNDEVLDDVIIDGYNGLLFNSNDELVEKMKYLFNNKDELLKIKNNTVESSYKFSKEIFVSSVLEIYEKVLKK